MAALFLSLLSSSASSSSSLLLLKLHVKLNVKLYSSSGGWCHGLVDLTVAVASVGTASAAAVACN